MGVLGENHSTQMTGLDSSFQKEESNYMLAEAIQEYALAYAETAYEDPGKHAPMGFMASGGESHEYRNSYHWWYQKRPSFTNQTYSENNNWETTAMHKSVEKEAATKAAGRENSPLE